MVSAQKIRIYGLHPVAAVFDRRPADIEWLAVRDVRTNPRLDSLRGQADALSIVVFERTKMELDRLVGGAAHQGVVANIRMLPDKSEEDLESLITKTANPLILILDAIQDPQNFGACLRSAEGCGVDAVIASRRHAVRLTPAVWKASSGAVEYLELVRVASVRKALQFLRSAGVKLVATAAAGGERPESVVMTGPLALIFGNEEKGLNWTVQNESDALLAIPMLGHVTSLNISVAVGIGLYEAQRQRRQA